MTVRVRFAPSPTGYLHIGGARTALFNFLFARHEKGVFVLRVDDTDQTRNTEASLQTILEGMKWLGLSWDEGPYHQADRKARYVEAAKELEAKGRAYWREDPGKGKALVFRIDHGRVEWDDAIHGPSGMDTTNDPDLVILKSDGYPTYNYATVVDEHDHRITHVIRGDEHFSNTPKQLMLFKAFGWEPPTYGHVPLIYDPQGRKISKREKYDFPVTIEEAQKMGYLPEALRNFIVLLGWSPGKDRELMTLDEMAGLFTLDRVGNTPGRFLLDKLNWMNSQYIKRKPSRELVEEVRPHVEREGHKVERLSDGDYLVNSIHLGDVVNLYRERMVTASGCSLSARFFFVDDIDIEPKAADEVLRVPGAKERLQRARAVLEAIPFEAAKIQDALKALAAELKCKMQDVAQPIRVAISGTKVSPPIHDTLAVMGKEKALKRIDRALAQM